MAEKKISDAVRAEEEKKYYDELVEVELFKDDKDYKDDVFVAVNGVGMIVPRGKKVKIPRKYALVIDAAQYQKKASSNYQAEVSKKIEE